MHKPEAVLKNVAHKILRENTNKSLTPGQKTRLSFNQKEDCGFCCVSISQMKVKEN